jgi:FK506-binding protein 4/5
LTGTYKGKVFETHHELTFTLGEGGDIGLPRGIEMALEKMKKKERVEVKLAPKYAFGSVGKPEKGVPPNSHVTYEIDLHSFERAKESWQMDAEMKVEQAKIFKEKGTEFFKQNKYELANNKYRKIIEFLEHELSLKGEIEEERKGLLLAGRLNLAMCLLKQNEWIEARNMCNKVLEERTDVPKAYFRRGEALMQLKDFNLAINDFQTVIELDPDNKAARNKVAYCLQEIKAQKNRDKKVFANMFDKFAKIDAKREEDFKRREKPVEISEWKENKNNRKGTDVLTVKGDINMDVDLSKAIDEQEAIEEDQN